MNQKSIITILGVVVIILIGATVYFATINKSNQSVAPIQKVIKETAPTPIQPTQPATSTNQQTADKQPSAVTENISCGKKYQADVVTIDGVDVVKKIVDLRSTKGKCELNIVGGNIAVAQKVDESKKVYTVVLYDKNDKQQNSDPFNQSVEIYQIDLNKNVVLFQNQFDGSFTKFGIWK